jgi:hypothetical protein
MENPPHTTFCHQPSHAKRFGQKKDFQPEFIVRLSLVLLFFGCREVSG